MTEVLKMFDLTPLDGQMIVVWAIGFIVLWQFMAALCWRPMLKLLAARELATTGAMARVHELKIEAEELERGHENEMLKARIDAGKVKADIVGRAKAEAQAKVSAAEATAAANLARSAEELKNNAQSIERSLEGEIQAMTKSALSRLGVSGIN